MLLSFIACIPLYKEDSWDLATQNPQPSSTLFRDRQKDATKQRSARNKDVRGQELYKRSTLYYYTKRKQTKDLTKINQKSAIQGVLDSQGHGKTM